jgi:hypothetical protein
LSCYIVLGSLGCARSAQQNVRSSVASARSAHLNLSVEFRGECARRAHQDRLQTQESLKVTEHLGGKTVQRRHRERHNLLEGFVEALQGGIERVQRVHEKISVLSLERTRVVEDSVELFQVGIEPVQVCTEELCCEFCRKRSVGGGRHLQSYRRLCGSARCA